MNPRVRSKGEMYFARKKFSSPVSRTSVYSQQKRQQGNQSNHCIFIEQTNMATSQWSDNDESNENVTSERNVSSENSETNPDGSSLENKGMFCPPLSTRKRRKRL